MIESSWKIKNLVVLSREAQLFVGWVEERDPWRWVSYFNPT